MHLILEQLTFPKSQNHPMASIVVQNISQVVMVVLKPPWINKVIIEVRQTDFIPQLPQTLLYWPLKPCCCWRQTKRYSYPFKQAGFFLIDLVLIKDWNPGTFLNCSAWFGCGALGVDLGLTSCLALNNHSTDEDLHPFFAHRLLDWSMTTSTLWSIFYLTSPLSILLLL